MPSLSSPPQNILYGKAVFRNLRRSEDVVWFNPSFAIDQKVPDRSAYNLKGWIYRYHHEIMVAVQATGRFGCPADVITNIISSYDVKHQVRASFLDEPCTYWHVSSTGYTGYQRCCRAKKAPMSFSHGGYLYLPAPNWYHLSEQYAGLSNWQYVLIEPANVNRKFVTGELKTRSSW